MKSFYLEDKKKINGDDSAKNLKKKSSTDVFVQSENLWKKSRNFSRQLLLSGSEDNPKSEILSNEYDNVKHHAMLQANQSHLKNSHLINGRNKSQLVNLNSFFADGKSLEHRKSQLEKLSLQYVLSKGEFSQHTFFISKIKGKNNCCNCGY
jgi:hypothetical protein